MLSRVLMDLLQHSVWAPLRALNFLDPDSRFCYAPNVLSVAYAPNGEKIATGDDHGMVTVRSSRTGHILQEMKFGREVYSVTFAPGSETIAISDDSGKVILWSQNSQGRSERHIPCGDRVNSLAYAPNGKTIATGERRGRVSLLSLVDRKTMLWASECGGEVHSVAYAPNGATIASGDSSKMVTVWSVAAGEKLWASECGDKVYSVAYAPNGATIASGDSSGQVMLWSAAGVKQRQIQCGPAGTRAVSVAFAPDGTKVACGDNRAKVTLWPVAKGKMLGYVALQNVVRAREAMKRERHKRRGYHFLHDSDYLPSWGPEEDWCINSERRCALGKSIIPIHEDEEAVQVKMAFAPDGLTIVTGSNLLCSPQELPDNVDLWFVPRLEAHHVCMKWQSRGEDSDSKCEEPDSDIKPDLDAMAGAVILYKCGGREEEEGRPKQKDFDKIVNKFALVLVPSIDMHIPQGIPSSGLFFQAIKGSSDMACQYSLLGRSGSVAGVVNEQILDGKEEVIVDRETGERKVVQAKSSLAQLKDNVSNHLLDAMTYDFTNTVSNRETKKVQIVEQTKRKLPTCVTIIAHGVPGSVKIGEEHIEIFDLLTRIRKSWVGNDFLTKGGRHPVQHVHFESCSVLKGVTTEDKKRHKDIADMVITGYEKDVGDDGVHIAQTFGIHLMHAISKAVADSEKWDSEEFSLDLAKYARLNLEKDIGSPSGSRGTQTTLQKQLMAFKII